MSKLTLVGACFEYEMINHPRIDGMLSVRVKARLVALDVFRMILEPF
jgi:hypothetical protein